MVKLGARAWHRLRRKRVAGGCRVAGGNHFSCKRLSCKAPHGQLRHMAMRAVACRCLILGMRAAMRRNVQRGGLGRQNRSRTRRFRQEKYRQPDWGRCSEARRAVGSPRSVCAVEQFTCRLVRLGRGGASWLAPGTACNESTSRNPLIQLSDYHSRPLPVHVLTFLRFIDRGGACNCEPFA